MSHAYHDALPGYSPAQILVDNCGECEARGASVHDAIARLDPANFARAWHRAALWNRDGLPDVSEAEAPLLRVLWSLQIQLERRGFAIGALPCTPWMETVS